MASPARQHGHPARFRPRGRLLVVAGAASVVILFLLRTYQLQLHDRAGGFAHTASKSKEQADGGVTATSSRHAAHTLVVYIFSNTDSEYENNLQFFLRWGVKEGDGCDYVFIMQTGAELKKPDLPADLPSNVRIEYHENGCYDWGTIGWLLDVKQIDTTPYKYFIFMNSSVRGPFLPIWAQGTKIWHELITSRITDKIKLVGPTISCEGSPREGNIDSEWRTNPHVQSYVLATDQIGFGLMRDDGKVFECFTNMWDTIYYSELGSSLAILKGGFNIDSFMIRYQNVDWRDESNWECNARVNPYGENYYDGISINPFEVMFVKVKGVLLANDWSYARVAKKYDEWMTTQNAVGKSDIVSNLWKTNPWPLKAPKIAYARARGPNCFDFNYYRSNNKDLLHIDNPMTLWEHYVTLGTFEGRSFRFTCEMEMQ